MITPKQATLRTLATTFVRGEYVEQRAGDIVLALFAQFAPTVRIDLHTPASLPNPVVTSRFPAFGVPLRVAIDDLVRMCRGVVFEVNDQGVVVFRSPTVQEQLKQALWVEQLTTTAKANK